jgi:hypothetical protein
MKLTFQGCFHYNDDNIHTRKSEVRQTLRLQNKLQWIIGLSILSVILVACGGDAPTDAPPPTETTAAEVVSFGATDAPTLEPTNTPTPVLPPPTAVPLEVQLSDLPAGEYSLSMIGTLNSDIGFTAFDPGLTGTEYGIAAGGSNLNGPYEFALWTDIVTDGTVEDTTARIIFNIPASAEAGEYDVVGLDAMSSPDDIGVGIETGFVTQRFASDATGTLTIIANEGVGGVFTGEFEVTVGDADGNTTLATGRASAIGFEAEESGELIITGAIEASPSIEETIYSLVYDTSTASNNDWRLDMVAINTETNPYIIQHNIYLSPNIAAGTYEIEPSSSSLDARPENILATAYVEIFNPQDGTRSQAMDVSGTIEILPIRDTFTATFTLNYTINEGEEVTATGGAFNLFKPNA